MPLTEKAIHRLTNLDILDAIIEEASELIYHASKAKRFGLVDVNPNKPGAESNLMEICYENVQIGTLIRILGARYGLRYVDICEAVRLKSLAQEKQGIGFNVQSQSK